MLTLSLFGCSSNHKYSERYDELQVDKVIKIEFRKPSNPQCQSKFEEFDVLNKELINDFVDIINNSELDGPWKGACFREIKIIMKDSVINLSTNGQVYGHGTSGNFYRFPEPETIEKFRSE